MDVTINGRPQTIADGTSVADLLAELDLEPLRVAVELNKELTPRTRFAEVKLAPGDALEIVTFVGGG